MAIPATRFDDQPVAAGRITSSTSELVVTTASSLRINAAVTNNGTNVVNLVKDGAGTLDFSDGNLQTNKSVNTYTGTTTINGGILIINAETQLGTAPGTNNAAAIVLNGGELRTTATIAIAAPTRHHAWAPGRHAHLQRRQYDHGTELSSNWPRFAHLPTAGPEYQQECVPPELSGNSGNYQGATIFSPNKNTATEPAPVSIR